MSSKVDLRLDWCSYQAAKYACEHWHYSRSIPNAGVRIGCWEKGRFIGAILYGVGAGCSTRGDRYGLNKTHDIAELVRVALTKHINPVSKIISISIKMIKRQSPKLKLLISFADEQNQGHYGGIYQATNWIYTGKSSSDRTFMVFGKKYHPKTIHSKGWVQSEEWLKKNIDKNAKVFRDVGKHRYLYPLNPEIRDKILPLSKPYPKRPKQAMAESIGTAAGQR